MLLNKIGIKITKKEPEKLNRKNDNRRFCDYVGEAREGKAFYIQNEDVSCPLACYNLGLEKFNREKTTDLAETLVGWNDASDLERALNYLKTTPALDYDRKYISLFPLDNKFYKPDLVILIDTPDNFMPVVRRITKEDGKWGKYMMSGVGGMCAESAAIPLVENKANVSLGCGGSRPHGRLNKGQLLIGMSYKCYKTYF